MQLNPLSSYPNYERKVFGCDSEWMWIVECESLRVTGLGLGFQRKGPATWWNVNKPI